MGLVESQNLQNSYKRPEFAPFPHLEEEYWNKITTILSNEISDEKILIVRRKN